MASLINSGLLSYPYRHDSMILSMRSTRSRGMLSVTMVEFSSRFWDWFRDVRIGEDLRGRVRLEYGEQVKVFRHEEPIGEALEELRRLDLKVRALSC